MFRFFAVQTVSGIKLLKILNCPFGMYGVSQIFDMFPNACSALSMIQKLYLYKAFQVPECQCATLFTPVKPMNSNPYPQWSHRPIQRDWRLHTDGYIFAYQVTELIKLRRIQRGKMKHPYSTQCVFRLF